MGSGFNMVGFMDLPGFERCIVRLLLRETELTYPELRQAVADMPEDLRMNEPQLESALDHLVNSEWVISQGDQLVSYRVSPIQRTSSHNLGLWDDIPLESIDQHGAYQLDLEPADTLLALKSGGKRALPKHIWDCLTDESPPEERTDTTPRRQTGVLRH